MDQAGAQEDPLGNPPQGRLQVGFPASARAGVNGPPPQSALGQALARMLIGQRSQIPIIDEPYALRRRAPCRQQPLRHSHVDDLAQQFLAMAGPFFLVGEIEWRLRRLLNKTYT